VEEIDTSTLLNVERKVFEAFKNPRYMSKVNIDTEINEKDLRYYYDRVNDDLVFRGFIIDKDKIKERRVAYKATLEKILIGAIIGIIFIVPGGSFLSMIALMILSPVSLGFILKDSITGNSRLTKKGKACLDAYINNFKSGCYT
jgi:hypothetical protein